MPPLVARVMSTIEAAPPASQDACMIQVGARPPHDSASVLLWYTRSGKVDMGWA